MRIFAFASLLIAVSPLLAQNDIQAGVNLQFRLVNPGARAQAMGGAFIGLADDTTAIFANPAGLVQMASQTAVLEANSTRRDNPIPFYQGRITQVGAQDFVFDLETREFPETTSSIPFFAYVQPSAKVKWGVFYAEQANFQRSFETGAVGIVPIFTGNPDVDVFTLGVFPSSENTLDLTLRTIGFSAATELAPGLSAGLTVGYNELDYTAVSTAYLDDPRVVFPDFNIDVTGLEPFIGKTFTVADARGTDQDLSYAAGLLYRASDSFRIGLAYRRQGEFDYDYTGSQRIQPDSLTQILAGTSSFDVPDSVGLGFAFQPTDVTRISVELNRVYYSDLSDSFVSLFFNDDDPMPRRQIADDISEYRVGFEYFFTRMLYPLAIRGGYWSEPYHALRNQTLDTQIFFRYLDENGDYALSQRASPFLQRFEEDLNHITFGLGMTFGDFTLDFSGDIDEHNSSFSLSSIYRF